MQWLNTQESPYIFMDKNMIHMLNERYPFITLCVYAGNEYLGVVQNQNDTVTTIYDFGRIQEDELKKRFLELAATWWWESNRSIPINIFLGIEWAPFKPYLRTFDNRDLEVIHGPTCSLIKIARKKHKRRSITLVRRVD
jgi:hypothetical protein